MCNLTKLGGFEIYVGRCWARKCTRRHPEHIREGRTRVSRGCGTSTMDTPIGKSGGVLEKSLGLVTAGLLMPVWLRKTADDAWIESDTEPSWPKQTKTRVPDSHHCRHHHCLFDWKRVRDKKGHVTQPSTCLLIYMHFFSFLQSIWGKRNNVNFDQITKKMRICTNSWGLRFSLCFLVIKALNSKHKKAKEIVYSLLFFSSPNPQKCIRESRSCLQGLRYLCISSSIAMATHLVTEDFHLLCLFYTSP